MANILIIDDEKAIRKYVGARIKNDVLKQKWDAINIGDKFLELAELQKDDLLKELNHLKGFLIAVEKKLGNEKFVQNAKPEVLALEQKKKADAEMKIKIIEESLALL